LGIEGVIVKLRGQVIRKERRKKEEIKEN